MATSILRLPAVLARNGESRSTTYARISAGLFVPPIALGSRSVGWPDFEVEAINAARIAGKTDDEIRGLVRELVAKRKAA